MKLLSARGKGEHVLYFEPCEEVVNLPTEWEPREAYLKQKGAMLFHFLKSVLPTGIWNELTRLVMADVERNNR